MHTSTHTGSFKIAIDNIQKCSRICHHCQVENFNYDIHTTSFEANEFFGNTHAAASHTMHCKNHIMIADGSSATFDGCLVESTLNYIRQLLSCFLRQLLLHARLPCLPPGDS